MLRGGYGETDTDYVAEALVKEIEVLNIDSAGRLCGAWKCFYFCEAIWELTVIPSCKKNNGSAFLKDREPQAGSCSD